MSILDALDFFKRELKSMNQELRATNRKLDEMIELLKISTEAQLLGARQARKRDGDDTD